MASAGYNSTNRPLCYWLFTKEEEAMNLNYPKRYRAIVAAELSETIERMYDYKGINGFLFTIEPEGSVQEFYLPEEILALILSYVNNQSLAVNCRLVCRSWKRIVEHLALRYKTEREHALRLKNGVINEKGRKVILPWILYYNINQRDMFGKNLIKNNCGQDGLKDWYNHSSRFAVENTPKNVPLPDFGGQKTCFVTSRSANKIQIIDLHNEGFSADIMDKYRPVICTSDWCTGRSDGGFRYRWRLALMNENKCVIDAFSYKTCFQGITEENKFCNWKQMKHEFKNYSPGVRYIYFSHGCSKIPPGNIRYTCKLSGTSVKLLYSVP